MLGAAIGGHAFCAAHTQSQRVDASKPLLEALWHLDDPQTGLLLLRECASFCKVAYSARVTPPALHTAALSAFDAEVRTCLEALCTGPLPGPAWAQASLSTSAGGLGLRLASRHASAGFLASTTATEELCKELDPHYMLSVNEVVDAFNRDVLPGDRIPSPVPNSLSQQKFSRALDAAAVAELSAPRRPPALICNYCSSLGPGPGYMPRLHTTSACMCILHSSESWFAFDCGCRLLQKMWPAHSATRLQTAWATTPGLALAVGIAPRDIIACALSWPPELKLVG